MPPEDGHGLDAEGSWPSCLLHCEFWKPLVK